MRACMKPFDVLFVHTNFPAQFAGLAAYLRDQPGVRVRAIASATAGDVAGVGAQRYSVRGGGSTAHAFARRFDQECRRAEQVIYAANALKLEGFDPQLIYVHPGWGEALPLRALFPRARITVYCEFYYRPRGADVGFDDEFGQFGVDGETRIAARNAGNLLALADADHAMAPTHWQRDLFPKEFRRKIDVIHDGIDTDSLTPAQAGQGGTEEIVTYAARNLEPYRGFHVFMRALPRILKARPNAEVYIAGGDGVSYGNAPAGHATWREAMLAEVGRKIDLSRVHFTGTLRREAYVALIRRSRVHCYLTYPFVLSWSMLEAMSLGALVVGSSTGPVEEVVEDGANGRLVPFGDPRAVADSVIEALAEPRRFDPLRRAARQTVVDRYDLKRVTLPAHARLIARRMPDWSGPTSRAEDRQSGAVHRLVREVVKAG
jgi:glycosyltransferase involved in cell wall biosynthesis